MLLPSTQIRSPYERLDPNSIESQMKRAVRMMHGHEAFQVVADINDEEASALADFAKLRGSDRHDEARLSEANKRWIGVLVKWWGEVKAEVEAENGKAS